MHSASILEFHQDPLILASKSLSYFPRHGHQHSSTLSPSTLYLVELSGGPFKCRRDKHAGSSWQKLSLMYVCFLHSLVMMILLRRDRRGVRQDDSWSEKKVKKRVKKKKNWLP